MLMMTRYVESREEKPVCPIRAGTWPAAILRAEPVMKAEIAVSEIRSTIQPQRVRPIVTMMHPDTKAKADATTFGGISGLVPFTWVTMLPTIVDMTATGYSHNQLPKEVRYTGALTPIVISLDVAKNQ